MRSRPHTSPEIRKLAVMPVMSMTGYATVLTPKSELGARERARASAPVWVLCAAIVAFVSLGAALGAWPLVTLLPLVAALGRAATRMAPAATMLVRCDLFLDDAGAYVALASSEGQRKRLASAMLDYEESEMALDGRELIMRCEHDVFDCLAPTTRELILTLFSDADVMRASEALEEWGRRRRRMTSYSVNTSYGERITVKHPEPPCALAQDVRGCWRGHRFTKSPPTHVTFR